MVHNTVDFRGTGANDSYLNILNYTVTEYIDMLEENNQIKLVNKTGCMDESGIYKIGLLFESYDQHNMESSRQMILGLIDSFLDALNNGCEGRLKPFLKGYPFTECNVDIKINFISNCKYPYPLPGIIKHVNFSEGMITYNTENPRCLGRLEILRREPICLARRSYAPVPITPYCP